MDEIRIRTLPALLQWPARFYRSLKRMLSPSIIIPLILALISSPLTSETVSFILMYFTALAVLIGQQGIYAGTMASGRRAANYVPSVFNFVLFLSSSVYASSSLGIAAPSFVAPAALVLSSLLCVQPPNRKSVMKYIVFETLAPATLVVIARLFHFIPAVTLLSALYSVPLFMAERSFKFESEYLIERSPFIFYTGPRRWLAASAVLFAIITAAQVYFAFVQSISPLIPVISAASATVFFAAYLIINTKNRINLRARPVFQSER